MNQNKILYILIGLSITLSAGNVNTDFANSGTIATKTKAEKKEDKNIDQKITIEEIKSYTDKYQELLGISNSEYSKLTKKYYKEDISWKKANYFLYKSKREISLIRTDKINEMEKNKKVKMKKTIPEWRKALKFFKISCIEHSNPISAAQGLDILLINLSAFDNTGRMSKKKLNKYFDDYLLVFTRILKSQEICYGYTGEVLYWMDRKQKMNKAKNIINEGWSICEKQVKENGIPKYLFDTLRIKAAKINAIIKIRKAKGEL